MGRYAQARRRGTGVSGASATPAVVLSIVASDATWEYDGPNPVDWALMFDDGGGWTVSGVVPGGARGPVVADQSGSYQVVGRNELGQTIVGPSNTVVVP